MSIAAAPLPEASLNLLLRRRIPAWLLSLLLHLAAVLVGSTLIGRTQLPEASDEPLRPASIVLARPSANSRTAYLVPDEPGEAEGAAQVTATPGSLLETGLPSSADSPPPSSLTRLPELPGPFAPSGETLVMKPQAAGGSGGHISRLSAEDKAAILAEDAARPRAQGPTGPTATLSLFGSQQAEGRSFVFLIDRSASMGGDGLGAIEAAATELATSVKSLAESHKFQLIAYNQKTLSLTGRELLPATAANKQQLIHFLKSLPAYGATQHDVGIYAALKLKPDAIFLLTDGGYPLLTAYQLKAIRTAAKGTAIHCLHFGSGSRGEGGKFMETLAEYTGGSYHYVDMAARP